MFRRVSILLLVSIFLVSCSLVNQFTNPPAGITAQPATETVAPAPATNTAVPPETVTPSPVPTQVITPTMVVTSTISAPEAPQFIQKQVDEPKYVIQPGTPLAVANFAHSEAGCNWSGIGGQVFNADGQPVTNLVVDIEGKLDGQDVLFLAITGTAPEIGPGGFVITFTNHPVASEGTMFFQVFNLQGIPQSNRILLTTYASCEQNMIVLNLNFMERKMEIYLPSIYQDSSKKTP